MAGPLRVTMFFTDGETGWSEGHYDLTSTSLILAVEKAQVILIPYRTQLLANGPWLKFLRASYDNVFRDSQVFFNPPPTNFAANGQYVNNPNWKLLSSAVDWTTALLRGESGDLYRKQVYISGVPYIDTADVGTPQADPVLIASFQNYTNKLILNGYGFPIWQRDTTTYPLQKVLAAVAGPIGGQWNLTINQHNFPVGAGNRVFLSQMKFVVPTGVIKGHVNGPFTYVVIDANTIGVLGFSPGPGTTFVSGIAQLNQKSVAPYTNFFMERFTHRKRGRPFDSPRGRSPRRRSTSYSVR